MDELESRTRNLAEKSASSMPAGFKGKMQELRGLGPGALCLKSDRAAVGPGVDLSLGLILCVAVALL